MYPYSSLAVITPIIFFILLLGFPVIGVFAGWKRAAYWGGGNFVFYIISLIIWKTAGGAISTLVLPAVQSLLGDKAKGADLNQLISSVIAPAYYLIILIISNIILVICYYTFAKKLLRIGKYKNWTRSSKNKQKGSVAAQKQVQVATKTKTQKVSVVDKRWFNMVVGGVGFTVLMLPITLTTTHAVALTTTSSSTRKSNSLTAALYNGLQGVSGGMDWFSFYNGRNAGKDYDALFSLISLVNTQITYKDINGNEVTADPVTALTDTMSKGMSNVIKDTKNLRDLETQEEVQGLANAINSMSQSWDSIIEEVGEDVGTLLNSTGITTVVKTMIGDTSSEPIKMTDQIIHDLMEEDSVYNQILEAYTVPKTDKQGNKYYAIVTEDGKETLIDPAQNVIEVEQESFNDLVDAVYSMYDVSQLSDESKQLLRQQTTQQIQMVITYK